MVTVGEIVPFELFQKEIDQLGALLVDELGISIPEGSDLERQTYQAFEALYYSIFSDERPTMSRQDKAAKAAALAGLGDIAAKINRAGVRDGFMQIEPHLRKMVAGAVRMNTPSDVTDEAANKNSELYVACLAIGAGLDCELEDPDHSAGGTNPDVLLEFAGQPWSIAVKACHSPKPPTIFGNIQKAVKQIERSNRTGIVFLNLKNIIDHGALTAASPFPSAGAAVRAVGGLVDGVLQSLNKEIVTSDWTTLFGTAKARELDPVSGPR